MTSSEVAKARTISQREAAPPVPCCNSLTNAAMTASTPGCASILVRIGRTGSSDTELDMVFLSLPLYVQVACISFPLHEPRVARDTHLGQACKAQDYKAHGRIWGDLLGCSFS